MTQEMNYKPGINKTTANYHNLTKLITDNKSCKKRKSEQTMNR